MTCWRLKNFLTVMVGAAAMTIGCSVEVALAQEPATRPTPPTSSVQGVVRAERTGEPIATAEVRAPLVGVSARTDSLGRFAMTGLPPGRVRLEIVALGFSRQEMTVRVPRAGTMRLDVELARRIQQLPSMDVNASELMTAEEAHARASFDQYTVPGVTTLSRGEMRALPTVGEPDVLRSLQMLPGVMGINDMDAQLYVRGGSADQNLFLFDGAPVYGAYHVFGMNGVFNSDAIENMEFFRGSRPARYGGALSSVISMRQREVMDHGTEGGVSMLGARFTHLRSFADDRVRWLVAGRRSLTEATPGERMPFAFHDAQTRLTIAPGGGHELSLSGFTSSDRFDLFFGDGQGELRSRWGNAVGSARWRSPRWHGWRATSGAWGSRYVARLLTGHGDSAAHSTDTLTVRGARLEIDRSVLGVHLLGGTELEAADVVIEGSPTAGSYFAGVARNDYRRAVLYGEADAAVGSLRFTPGIRVVRPMRGGKSLLEPRISIRAQMTRNASLTVGASRDHQVISTLRDERTVLPGPPFWFMHPAGAPVSRADALTAELTAWFSSGWQLTVSGYERRFSDLPRWRPMGVRDLTSVRYDDGSATGAELSLRRFGRSASGWIGYSFNDTRLVDSVGKSYRPVYDRQHAVNTAIVVRPRGRLVLSAQGAFGTGLPLWPFVGHVVGPQLNPFDLPVTPGFPRGVALSRPVPLWADRQIRQPMYARIDVGLRRAFFPSWGSVEPYLNIQNVGARPNVIYYETERGVPVDTGFERSVLRPVALPFTILPTLGIDVRF